MPVAEHDLRAVLSEHSELPSATISSVARRDQVGRRVRIIRRHRAVGAGAALACLLFVAALAPGLITRGGHNEPLPPVQRKVAHGLLPLYDAGGRATAYRTFRTDAARTATLTFTPLTRQVRIATTCAKDMPDGLMMQYAVNGQDVFASGCGTGLTATGASWGDERGFLSEVGLRPGTPATITARIVKSSARQEPASAPTYLGTLDSNLVAFGVYTPVPRATYPLPRRPKKLDAYSPEWDSTGLKVLGLFRGSQVGRTGTSALTVPLPRAGLVVDVDAGAPGQLSVAVNGTTMLEWSSWTWVSGTTFDGLIITPRSARAFGLDLAVGEHVRVTVTARYFAEPRWSVRVARPAG